MLRWWKLFYCTFGEYINVSVILFLCLNVASFSLTKQLLRESECNMYELKDISNELLKALCLVVYAYMRLVK